MDRIKISDGNFKLEFPARGKESAAIFRNGEKLLSFGRVQCGKFSEVGALEKKLRVHPNQDSLSADIESANVIPFGCEYEISRDIHTAAGFMRFVTDIRAVNFGRVGDVSLEEVRFHGKISSVRFFICGSGSAVEYSGDIPDVLYEGSEPLLLVTVTYSDNSKVDFGCGSDVWRLRSAADMAGVTAVFSFKKEDDDLVLVRRPLIYGAETEVEQRPWRFKSIISWRDAGEESSALPYSCGEFKNAPCMLEATARRQFRRAVRRSECDLVCTGSLPAVCTDAAHLEKPDKKELIHFDLEEYFTSFVWANRQLGRKARSFRFAFGDTVFAGSASVENLSSAIRALEFEDDQE